ncbi:hypothetical protein BHM03_00049476 [Ensete ventricosum]|nr:hypothetical protein BHM03_00049476 [Ensete ventricosum]
MGARREFARSSSKESGSSLEHAGRSSKEDHKTHRKNAGLAGWLYHSYPIQGGFWRWHRWCQRLYRPYLVFSGAFEFWLHSSEAKLGL